MTNIAIIYHDADFDGRLSNEVCRCHLQRLYPSAQIHSYGWDYGRPVPEPLQLNYATVLHGERQDPQQYWADYDRIYIVDLSVDELMAIPELQPKIVWIDHHASAIKKWDLDVTAEVLRKLAGYRIDGVAACRLCWQWFTSRSGIVQSLPSKQQYIDRQVFEPELIRLAGEYDIWDHRDPNGKALQFGLKALTTEEFDLLIDLEFVGLRGTKTRTLPEVIEMGRAIKSYCDINNDEYSAAYASTLVWEGLVFCQLNIGQRGNSDLLRGGILPAHQALFAWRYDGRTQNVLVSLYHAPGHEDLDLSQIAVRYGGGGHRGACGFRLSLLELAAILDNRGFASDLLTANQTTADGRRPNKSRE